MTKPPSTDTLVELLDRKRSGVLRLRELARRQNHLLGVGGCEASAWLKLLHQRQAITDELRALHQEIDRSRFAWRDLSKDMDPQTRRQVSALIDRLHDLLLQIGEEDGQTLNTLAMISRNAIGGLLKAATADVTPLGSRQGEGVEHDNA